MAHTTKQHGGHNRGQRSARSTGGGPVFIIREALGITRAEMAEALGYTSGSAIKRLEQVGGVPKAPAKIETLKSIAWRMSAGEVRTQVLADLETQAQEEL